MSQTFSMILTSIIGLSFFIFVYTLFTTMGSDFYKPATLVSAKEVSDYISSTIGFSMSAINSNNNYLGKHYSSGSPIEEAKIALYCYTTDCATLKTRFDAEQVDYNYFNGVGVDTAENRPILTPLINTLSSYDVVVLEDPYISIGTTTTDAKIISDELDDFLLNGGSIIASGHGNYIEKFAFTYVDGGSNSSDLECTVDLFEKNMGLLPGISIIPSTIPYVSSGTTISSYDTFSGDCISFVEYVGGGKVYYFSDFLTKNTVDLEGGASLMLKSWQPALQGNIPNMVVFLHLPNEIMDKQYVIKGNCDENGISWIKVLDKYDNILSIRRTSVNCVDSFISGKVFASEDVGIGFYKKGKNIYVEVANYGQT
ncbi:MAG: hypothetical protein KAS30_05485 [Candidatus Diapherotrites archaeon]|nr:hypothetical protein [Candidatus Diapherotrites archaeon]